MWTLLVTKHRCLFRLLHCCQSCHTSAQSDVHPPRRTPLFSFCRSHSSGFAVIIIPRWPPQTFRHKTRTISEQLKVLQSEFDLTNLCISCQGRLAWIASQLCLFQVTGMEAQSLCAERVVEQIYGYVNRRIYVYNQNHIQIGNEDWCYSALCGSLSLGQWEILCFINWRFGKLYEVAITWWGKIWLAQKITQRLKKN